MAWVQWSMFPVYFVRDEEAGSQMLRNDIYIPLSSTNFHYLIDLLGFQATEISREMNEEGLKSSTEKNLL
jgi:hypothetical protein